MKKEDKRRIFYSIKNLSRIPIFIAKVLEGLLILSYIIAIPFLLYFDVIRDEFDFSSNKALSFIIDLILFVSWIALVEYSLPSSVKRFIGGISKPASAGPVDLKIPSEIKDISDWKIYTNKKYGFELKHPKDWRVDEYPKERQFTIGLPLDSGNALKEKCLNIKIKDLSIEKECRNDFWSVRKEETISLNGLKFEKEISEEYNKDQRNDVFSYSTEHFPYCFVISCWLAHINNSLSREQIESELEVFGSILTTLKFLE